MVLKFLGNGSGFCVDKGNNCAYLKEDDKILFFDFGDSTFEKVVSQGLLNDVNHVFVALTHLHGDHAGGMGSLCLYDTFAKQVPTHIVESDDYSKDSSIMQYLILQGCGGMYDFVDGSMAGMFKNIKNVKFEKVSHVQPIDSFSIELELADGRTLFYSGDTNDEDYIKRVVSRLKPKDEFYCDCCLADYVGNVHTNIEKLKKLVPHDKRKQVYCMHLDNDKLYELADEYGFKVAMPLENGKQMQ